MTNLFVQCLLTVGVLVPVIRCGQQSLPTYDGVTLKKCPMSRFCQIESTSSDQVINSPTTFDLLAHSKFSILEDVSRDGVLYKKYRLCNSACRCRAFLNHQFVKFNYKHWVNITYDRHEIFPLNGGISPYNQSYADFQSCLDSYCDIFHKFPFMTTLRCNADYSKRISWPILQKSKTIGDPECEKSIKFLNLKGIDIGYLNLYYFDNFSFVRIDITGYVPRHVIKLTDFTLRAPWIEMTESHKNMMFIKKLATAVKRFHIIRTDQNYYFYYYPHVEVFNIRNNCSQRYKSDNFFVSTESDCPIGKKFVLGNQMPETTDRYEFPNPPFDEASYHKDMISMNFMIQKRTLFKQMEDEVLKKREIGAEAAEEVEETKTKLNRTTENEEMVVKGAQIGAGLEDILGYGPRPVKKSDRNEPQSFNYELFFKTWLAVRIVFGLAVLELVLMLNGSTSLKYLLKWFFSSVFIGSLLCRVSYNDSTSNEPTSRTTIVGRLVR